MTTVPIYVQFEAPGQLGLTSTPPEREFDGRWVRIKSAASLISRGTELRCLNSDYEAGSHWDDWVQYPFRPGYSLVGHVSETAPGVHSVEVGERVAVNAPHGSEALVDEAHVYRIPASVDNGAASWFALAAIAQAAVKASGCIWGHRVAILGDGGLGNLLARFVLCAGAQSVTVCTRENQRVWNTGSKCGLGKASYRAVSGLPPYDVAFDATNGKTGLGDCSALVKQGGSIILVGDTGFPSEKNLSSIFLTRGQSIQAVHEDAISHTAYAASVINYFTMLSQGRMSVADLSIATFPGERAAEAYALLKTQRGGALLLWNDQTEDARDAQT